MVTYRSLAELEDAHDHERQAARMRIDLAEQYISYYRSRIDHMRETFYYFGQNEGVADDPGFRDQLQRVSEVMQENVLHAGRKVGELEEEYDAMLKEQFEERERYVAQSDTRD